MKIQGEEMLYLVGLGLGDAKDITVKGLEIVKKADYVFLEAYTSILCVGKEVLVGKKTSVFTRFPYNPIIYHACSLTIAEAGP